MHLLRNDVVRTPLIAPLRLRAAFVAGVAALLAVTVPVIVVDGRPLAADLAVGRALIAPGSDVVVALTQLGSGAVLYPVLAAVAVWRRVAGTPWRAAVTPLLVFAAVQTLEAVTFVTLVRPGPLGGVASFSSGHATAAVLGWGLVAGEFGVRGRYALVAAVGAVVGLSRVALGAHWLSDVVAGWGLGVAVLAAVCAAPAVTARRAAGTRPALASTEPGSAEPGSAGPAPAGPAPAGPGSAGPVAGRSAAGGAGRDSAAGTATGSSGGSVGDVAGGGRTVGVVAAVPPGTRAAVQRWLTTARGAWVIPAVAALVPLVPLVVVPGPDRMKDLLVYYGAGSTAGSGSDVYEFRTVFDMPFTYPPFAAVLSEPLSRVPLGLLQVLWVVASLAALVGVARFAMRPVVTRIGLPLTLALLLVSAPVRSHLRFGQVGLFLVLLVAVDLLRRHRREGLGLGVAIAVKLTPAVFVPWLLVTGRFRTFVVVTATSVAATVAGLLLLWPSAAEYLWRALWDSDRFGANDVVGNQSVRGMLLRTGLPDHAVSLLWLASALVLVAVGTFGAWRLERDGNRLGAVGVLAALSVAVSPISWVHHLVWLVLPLAALVAARRYGPAAAWAAVLTASLPSLGAAGLRAGTGHPVFWHLVVDAQGLTAVATVVFLPWLLRARARSAARGSTRRCRSASRVSPAVGDRTIQLADQWAGRSIRDYIRQDQ